MKESKDTFFFTAGVAFVVLFLDVLSKELVMRWGNFGSLAMPIYFNAGISFGIGNSLDWMSWWASVLVWVGLAVVVSILVVRELLKGGLYGIATSVASGLFLGGIWANTFDRVAYGAVRDWLPVPGLGLYNNLADWAIALACIVWIYLFFFKTKTS